MLARRYLRQSKCVDNSSVKQIGDQQCYKEIPGQHVVGMAGQLTNRNLSRLNNINRLMDMMVASTIQVSMTAEKQFIQLK